MTAQARGWGPPGCTRSQLERIAVPGIPLNVRREVAPLFRELVAWLTAERRKAGAPALSSSGGYVKRYIAGTTTYSNHSWGLAADFNAATNPYRVGGPTDMPPGTSEKAASLGMRWGGDYTGKRDAMHFEFMGTPGDAARIAATLRTYDLGYRVLREGMRGPRDVAALQALVTATGIAKLAVDDDFGPATTAGVRACQHRLGLDVDGVAGPVTIAALEDSMPLSDDDVERIARSVWIQARTAHDGLKDTGNVPLTALWAVLRVVNTMHEKVDELLEQKQ